MNATHDRAKSIFLSAAEIATPGERKKFVESECQNDDALRREVDELLRHQQDLGSFLESPALAVGATTDHRPITEQPGTVIGPYKLLQQIGEGGMGVVFMAEQIEPIQRTVALKIIKPGMDTRQVIARFEAERQALAMMDHPNIAKVLDAGTTETGRPYFVMELVKGVPITKYCDEKQLSLHQRLELYKPVCEAVQHAHQKGIIHRDIKPTNVLVAEYDHHAIPKVIDFGVAKATAQKLTEHTMFTEFGQVIGTVEYMSPEQAKFNQLDIDTRSDIYSLGVLLYELLTSETPFDRDRLRTAAIDEVLRIIREEEPPKPSTKLSSSDTLPSIAANRHSEPARLSKDVRGELDWIVMKALEKDRDRRYETANGLARDVERYLQDESVQACPPSATYRFRKFARRNRVALVVGAIVATSLVLGAAVSTWQAVRATRAGREAEIARENEEKLRQHAEASEKKAQTEALHSRQVARFLADMLNGVGPWIARGRDTSILRDIMDSSAARVGTALKDQPDVEAELRNVMGEVYRSVGEYEKAEAMHRTALALYRKQLGNEHALVAQSLRHLAGALGDQSKWAEAEPPSREALTMQRKLLGNEHEEVAQSLRNLATILWSQKKLAEAEVLGREALAMRRKLYGDEHVLVADALKGLAGILVAEGRYVEAEALVREALAMLRKLVGNYPNGDVASTLETLADALGYQGKSDEGEAAAREALDIASKATGQGSPWTVASLYRLAVGLEHAGKLDELEEVFNNYPVPARGSARRRAELLRRREAIFVRKGDSQEQAAARAAEIDKLSESYGEDSPRQSEASWRREIAVCDRLARENPGLTYYRWRLAECHFELANMLQTNGRREDALKEYEASAQLVQKLVPDEPDNRAGVERAVAYQIAFVRCALSGDRDDSEKICRHMLDFLAMLTELKRMDRNALGGAYIQVGILFGGAGRSQEAEQAYRSAMRISKQLAAEFPDVPDNSLNMGHAYRLLNQQEKAVAEFSSAIEKWPDDARFLHWRASSLCNLGKFDQAMADLQEAFRMGYADIEQLNYDMGFDPIRTRDDFKSLLRDAEKKRSDGKVSNE